MRDCPDSDATRMRDSPQRMRMATRAGALRIQQRAPGRSLAALRKLESGTVRDCLWLAAAAASGKPGRQPPGGGEPRQVRMTTGSVVLFRAPASA